MRRPVRLKGIKAVRVRGKLYLYRRTPNGLVPLPNLPENHPDFIAAYQAAELVRREVVRDGTLSALCQSFLASGEFRERKTSTQQVWRRIIGKIQNEYGKAPIQHLRPTHIRKDLAKLTPGAARSKRTVWRALAAYAINVGDLETDFTADVKNRRYQSNPHEPWTLVDIAAFRDTHALGTPARAAFETLYWTGARCVDGVGLGWPMVDGGVLEYTQNKTGYPAVCPITAPVHPDLLEDRDVFLAAIRNQDAMWITTNTGKPRSVKSLSQEVSKWARQAGVEKTAHGLRKARGAALGNARFTQLQIQTWLGHRTAQESNEYTRSVDRRSLVTENEQSTNTGKRVLAFSKKGEK